MNTFTDSFFFTVGLGLQTLVFFTMITLVVVRRSFTRNCLFVKIIVVHVIVVNTLGQCCVDL